MPSAEAEFLVETQDEHVARRRKQILIGGVAVIVSVALVVILVMIFAVDPSKSKNKLNVILMISDGWGPASATLTRAYSKQTQLNIDPYLIGTVRTASYDSLVTDSAAGATAYSCGKHTYNGGIGIDEKAKAVATVLEGASKKGMRTGVVTTTRVTDATPAAFASHSVDRDYEDFIATQILDMVGFEKNMDVILGGGRIHFDPNYREDKQDLLSYAKDHGYNVVQNLNDMGQVTKGKILGLFADENMAYAIDRVHNATLSASQPSLLDMTKKAFELLENNDQGFFVMLEGALIDVSEHANDAATSINEVLGYDETFAYVLEYAKNHGNTIIISTSDHETGGLTLGLQTNFTPDAYPTYAYYPELFYAFNSSGNAMATRILAGGSVVDVIGSATNITDLSAEEIAFISQYTDMKEMSGAIGTIVSKRSLIGWTTHGHTGVDVNLYAYGIPEDSSFLAAGGNHENIDVAALIADLLGLDLDSLSQEAVISDFPTTPSILARRSVSDTYHRHRLH